MTLLWQFFLYPISPIFALTVTSMGLIFFECFPALEKAPNVKFGFAITGASVALLAALQLGLDVPSINAASGAFGSWYTDFLRFYEFNRLVAVLFIGISLFTLLSLTSFAFHYQGTHHFGSALILPLFVAIGMMIMVSSRNLLVSFLGLELLSLPTYVLVGMSRTRIESCEAALKYFLYGSFATVLFILGVALVFRVSHSLDYHVLRDTVGVISTSHTPMKPVLLAGFAFIMIALLFKAGIAPFHFWVPDAYNGASSPATGFMGSAVKFTAFAVLIQLFWGVFGQFSSIWQPIFTFLGVLTAFVGNIAAIRQDDLKRLLAFSSVAHAGYLLLGLTSFDAGNALYYYLLTYGITFLGLFTLITLLEKHFKSTTIYQLSGLGFSHPFIGFCLAFFILSIAGIPPLTGFLAKYFLFYQVFRSGNSLPVVLTLISTAIGMYAYLRWIVFLYMKETRLQFSIPRNAGFLIFSLTASLLLLIYFGINPIA